MNRFIEAHTAAGRATISGPQLAKLIHLRSQIGLRRFTEARRAAGVGDVGIARLSKQQAHRLIEAIVGEARQ